MRNQISFPEFKSIDIHDKHYLDEFTRKFSPYSDFNFISLWCYDTNNDVAFSWLNKNLVIGFRDYLTKSPFYSFLGDSYVVETINQLLEYSKHKNLPKELKLIPEINIHKIIESKYDFTIHEDIDQNDYIIPLKETIDLSNINPHKKKSYYNFITNYSAYIIRELNLGDYTIQHEMINLLHEWQYQKKQTDDEIKNEKMALQKLFTFQSYFNLFALGIFLNSKLIGFIIDERLEKPYVIGHFIKANLLYRGIYEVLNQVSAERHYKEGYQYINIEQDLGIEGLRISKLQRSPSFFLRKYIIKAYS